MLYWLRQGGVLLVIVVAAVAFSNVRQTPERLWSLYAELWPQRAAVRQEWRTELAGEQMLAEKVHAMLSLLRENRVQSFRYSAGIAADPDPSVVQRIAESAYPIRYRPDAKDVLQLATEPLDARCTAVAGKPGVLLAHCS